MCLANDGFEEDSNGHYQRDSETGRFLPSHCFEGFEGRSHLFGEGFHPREDSKRQSGNGVQERTAISAHHHSARCCDFDNVVPDEGLQDVYFDELREVLVKHAEEQLMNVTMHEDVDSLIANADKYAGFISIGPSPLDRKTLHRLHRKLPHGVFIDINPAPELFDSVQPDLEQTILDAIDALTTSGCSRIGFIGGLGNIMGEHEYPEDIRTFAFRNWTLRLDLDVQGLVYANGPFTVENGRLQGRQLLQDHADDLPDAVIVAADPLAVGVLQAFATENVIVPRDIKVISINNQEIAKYTSPALSSYDISQDELTKAAVLMLAEALTANRKISQHMRISTSLVARDSFTPQD